MLGSLLLATPHAARANPEGFLCSDYATAVLVDGQQRTLVGGVYADNRVLEWDSGHAHYGDFAVARLLADGSVDPSFGDAGTVILDEGDFDSVAAMGLSWDGVVVGGTTRAREDGRSGSAEAVVFKLDAQGQLVEAFGEAGVARLGLGGSELIESVKVGWRGHVYVAGTLEETEATRGFIARLNRHGRLDSGFGVHGVVELADLAGMDRVHGMELIGGALMVAGERSSAGTTEAVVARLDRRGQLIRCFGEEGIASTEIPEAPGGQGTAFFSGRGDAVVSLPVASQEGSRIATVRFDRHGRVVPGPDGYLSILDAPTGTQDSVSAGAFSWSRALYLVGATYPDDFATGDAFLARGATDGSGFEVTSANYDLEYAAFNDLAVTRTGLTVVGWDFGEADDTLPPSDGLVVRYGHDGALDRSFGDGGVVKLDYMGHQAVCGPRIVEE